MFARIKKLVTKVTAAACGGDRTPADTTVDADAKLPAVPCLPLAQWFALPRREQAPRAAVALYTISGDRMAVTLLDARTEALTAVLVGQARDLPRFATLFSAGGARPPDPDDDTADADKDAGGRIDGLVDDSVDDKAGDKSGDKGTDKGGSTDEDAERRVLLSTQCEQCLQLIDIKTKEVVVVGGDDHYPTLELVARMRELARVLVRPVVVVRGGVRNVRG